MASLISNSFKLKFNILFCEFDEYQMENPYNTICEIVVDSNGFSGKAEMTVNYKDLVSFSNNLESMYKTLYGIANIKALDFGIFLNVECNNMGYFNFNGVLISEDFQELKFVNALDQTYVKEFVYDLIKEVNSIKR